MEILRIANECIDDERLNLNSQQRTCDLINSKAMNVHLYPLILYFILVREKGECFSSETVRSCELLVSKYTDILLSTNFNPQNYTQTLLSQII
ncbi:hypothetical protein I7I50_02025 [Histoplasma capsulatum G186AR]|uniref:Uncharacterized protein n=1 Tax=Ajellomyces capsulatus TaxID=5037 RepID=A0A8H8CSW5_AJECA|nr:hypothetical protein I7I52_12239 [Histoplasma capsulatum]QSS71255.1 hypothetical protein I7I50_02025 [Histoplasma capsulatum G186AR]